MFIRAASAFCLTIAFTGISNQITLAESVNVYFSGTVEPRASFNSYTPGKIESSLSGKGAKSTNSFNSIAPAKINLQASSPTTISVSSAKLSTNDAIDTGHIPTLRVGSSQISGNNVTLPAGKNTVEVDLLLKNQVYTPGTYTYDVTVTMVNP
jgi:hypothetical protein